MDNGFRIPDSEYRRLAPKPLTDCSVCDIFAGVGLVPSAFNAMRPMPLEKRPS